MTLPWFYFLTDSIYPDWQMLVKLYKSRRNEKEKTFGKQQQSVRRAIEHFFGVILRRYRILHQPCALWFKADMASIMQACVMMHSMNMREREAAYAGTRAARVEADAAEAEDAGTTTHYKLHSVTDRIALVEWMYKTAGQVENRKHHEDLNVGSHRVLNCSIHLLGRKRILDYTVQNDVWHVTEGWKVQSLNVGVGLPTGDDDGHGLK